MIECYLPTFLKLCKLAEAVKLLTYVWQFVVINIGPDFYCLYGGSFFVVLLGRSQLFHTDTRVVPQNEAQLFSSTSYQIHY
jgi:hypothetical protein